MKTVNARRLAKAAPQVKHDYLPFLGGLDLTTPKLQVEPGKCREAQNYEVDINGGYRRIKGYERVDGQAAPSAAQYAILAVTITGSVEVADTITGDTSGATAAVIAIASDSSYLVVTKIDGTFEPGGEDLMVAASKEAESTASPVTDGASSALLHAQYNNLAADEYRSDITAVPGSGNVLGGFVLADVVYALRNNAGGTAAVLHKSSASGWTAVSLGFELAFTAGDTAYTPVEGDEIEGETSGATATLTRVVLESGAWGTDAAGRFIFASQDGTFQAEDVKVGANLSVATIAADSSAITLDVNGRLETDKANFGGQSGTERIYGCDGVNRGFEFDGTVYVPIDTGMTTDAPTHVIVHKHHLFFSFGSSAQHSGTGTPYIWTPIFGAAELAVGDDITGFKQEGGGELGEGALSIFSRDKTHVLYGSSSSDWNLVAYRDELGGFAYSIQQVGTTLILDDRGVNSFRTAQEYGNFLHSTLTRTIQPWINQRKSLLAASCVSREKSQYRLFFSDNSALYITFDAKYKMLGMMPMQLADTPKCAWSVEFENGNEAIYFGDDSGFVYQMEKGTSFDGDEIEAFLVLHYHHSKTPRIDKAYFGGMLEVEGTGYASFNFTYELSYTDPMVPQPGSVEKTLLLSSAKWDSFVWDAAFWDTRSLVPCEFDLDGNGTNISLIIRSESDYDQPLLFSGALIRYSPRLVVR